MSLPRAKKVSLEARRPDRRDASRTRSRTAAVPVDTGDLDLDDNPLSAAAVEALGHRAFVRGWCVLSLARTAWGTRARRRCPKWPAFRGLRTLSLARDGADHGGLDDTPGRGHPRSRGSGAWI